jgi:putative transposase
MLDYEPRSWALRHERIQAAVSQVHAESQGILWQSEDCSRTGPAAGLASASRNTVAQAMRELGQKSRISRRFTPTATQANRRSSRTANASRNLTAKTPNHNIVADAIYPPSRLDLSGSVLDLFSGKVVGWAVSDSQATPLVAKSLRQAVESRHTNSAKLLHHKPPVSENPGLSQSCFTTGKAVTQPPGDRWPLLRI